MEEGNLTCSVLFFASAAEAVGCDSQELTLQRGSTVSDVFDAFAQNHPQFAAMKRSCAITLNTSLCSSTAPLHDGCTVAFLPPVSGG